MKRCDHCGHHHGQRHDNGTTWPACGAVAETDTGGARRCGCKGES